ncbi:MAG: hypothetical protein HY000_27675 [Planctomycetes bacterium]|nr:hypothetical protein [Planctomycetota bacterium]
MPTFLWFYVGGLMAALVVGFIFYFVVGAYCGPLLQRLFGDQGGYLWGRTFRIMLVTSALVGGLSTQWYGCHGYEDYADVERSPKLMFQKSTEQVGSATNYATGFLLIAANVAVIAYAILRHGKAPADGPTAAERRASPSQEALQPRPGPQAR